MKSNDPKHDKPLKKKKGMTFRCVVCNLPFGRLEVTCRRCQSCQGCLEMVNDPNSNYCPHCDNYLDQSRYDEMGQMMNILHNPKHETDDFEEKHQDN